jgi:hypothetical protein
MVTNTVRVSGLVITSTWEPEYSGPVELLIRLDPGLRIVGKGISDRSIHRLSIQSMAPESMRILGNLRSVGDWLSANKPDRRSRPQDPSLFYSHVALFFVLGVQEGAKGVTQVLANYASVRPSKARMWVETARKLGLLSANNAGCQVGRARGVLTDKARTALAGQSVKVEGEAAPLSA